MTPDWQREFIAHLAATGIVTQAAKHIGASHEALYKLRARPGAEEFAHAWERAVDMGVSRLEDCALARAIAGEERMVVSAGKVVGTERGHNEALTMFLLRHRRVQRFNSHIRPGHPIYERIRQEVLDARVKEQKARRHEERDLQMVLDRIMAVCRENWMLREKLEEHGLSKEEIFGDVPPT